MLIGLTGLTGSGKTSASRILEGEGAFVIDCDKLAHTITEDAAVKEKLRASYGNDIFNSDGSVNRKELGKIVFSDREKLLLLNSILHPEITKKVMQLAKSSPSENVIIDGSELEASGIDEKCRHIIVIEADADVRKKRIMLRDGISEKDASLRIEAQRGYSKKAFTVTNNEGEKELSKKLVALYKKLTEE